jgi:hypothetical protein
VRREQAVITEYEENGHGEPIVSAPRKVVDRVMPGRGGFLPGTRVAMVSAGSRYFMIITGPVTEIPLRFCSFHLRFFS